MAGDRNSTKIDIAFALLILLMCGLLQAEVSRILGNIETKPLSEGNWLLAFSSYVVSMITPFALAFLVLLVLIYSLRVAGVNFQNSRVFVIVGFSFVPFLLNSAFLYACVFLFEDNLGINDDTLEIYLTSRIKLSDFRQSGLVASALFIVALVYQLSYVEKYLKPILAIAVVCCPLITIYVFTLLFDFF